MGKKFLIFAVSAVILVIGGIVVKNLFFGPSDRELIIETMSQATEAAANGEASPVLDALSRNFEYGGEMPISLDIADVVRKAKPTMIILDPEPKIDGDFAVVESDVQFQMDFMGAPVNYTVTDVTIELQKETSFSSLIPKPKWRVTKVEADDLPYGI